ncbi:MAG TPA: polyprenol monophosphomannose synthase [Chloroflexota bacterium]|nr:polyprenol monophosphomannose synthase [Chloroflexota bacterium]
MRTVVVIPTYNEAENLRPLADALLANPDYGLLVVDDNSPDGTGAIADGLAEGYPGRVTVLHRAGKAGLGTAYVEGFRQALRGESEYIVQMDADFSHSPADVPRLVAALDNADVAIGSRYVRGGGAENWPLIRWLVSRGGSRYTQLILGVSVQDPTSGFKCFRRDALARIDLERINARGFGFQVEMNWRCHQRRLRVVEVPIRFVDRKLGQSKMSSKIFFEALVLVWQLRFRGSSGAERPNLTPS